MGAAKALLGLFNVHPQLPGRSPLTARLGPIGRSVMRTEAVAPFASNGRGQRQRSISVRVALGNNLGQGGGATQLVPKVIPKLQN